MGLIVLNGNNIELLKNYPDNYFDSVVTDPPYGLGKEPNPSELMRAWLETGYHEIQGKGFMGKEWDAFVPQPIFWKEVFRVLKHGGHVVAFYGTRTYDWGVMAMRFAGFEVRDCIQWLYGSGFPKSHNISKAIDKLNGVQSIKGELKFKGGTQLGVINDDSWKPKDVYEEFANSEDAKNWQGWGSALKPANEPIVLARKPLEKGLSIAENVLKWGVGGINIDGCRIGTSGGTERNGDSVFLNEPIKGQVHSTRGYSTGHEISEINKGRFPANLILTHHPECECKGVKKVKAISGGCKFNSAFFKSGESNFTPNGGIGDENGEETIEDWDCHPDCPIKILDEQSGVLKSGQLKSGHKQGEGMFGKIGGDKIIGNYGGDSGGASRFFYVAKASKSERNKGLDDFEEKPLAFSNQAKAELKRGNSDFDGGDAKGHGNSIRHLKNFHPTVKPVKLMQYLVRLITPPNGIVLDPFCGSGTTGIACKLEGFEFVGMEQDPEYSKIAEARISNWVEEKEKTPKQKENSSDEKIYFKQTSLF